MQTPCSSGEHGSRANIRIITGADSTEIEVGPGATYPGLIRLGDRIGIVRKVHHVLSDSVELNRSNQAVI